MVIISPVVEEPCSSSIVFQHDVFLSFRGIDTRYSFTGHLLGALKRANLKTFFDDETIETGRILKPELERGIRESRVSVVVLSKNYANSSSCLDELVWILDQRMKSNQIVIPIFYHVEPNHIKKQQSTFGDAMDEHIQEMEKETNAETKEELAGRINRWKKALTIVGTMKGEHIAEKRHETELIEKVIKEIYHTLRIPLGIVLPELIGMEDSIQHVTSWLKADSSHTGDLLTISGLGGIGKTSLVERVYWSHSREFDASSYIGNISGCKNVYNGLRELQKKLYCEITKPSTTELPDIESMYTSQIENAIARYNKVLIVLDDVDSVEKLDALLGRRGFRPGCKIIITTRDTSLIKGCALFKTNVKPKLKEFPLNGLCETTSRQLFCFHACISNDIKEGYKEPLEKLVKYCDGHPLALKVLGGSLIEKDVAIWEESVGKLNTETDLQINDVLKMSFDSLPSGNDKELFKHISCFFVGTDRDYTETILKACGIKTFGITNLIAKCLLSIGCDNELVMHNLVQEMGRSVVREESPNKPWMRSRLWHHEESFKVLKQEKGTDSIKGLAFDMRTIGGSFELKTDALRNMDTLMLLKLNYVQIDGSYKIFANELRWLCMHGYPLESIPFDSPMENLVALDMSHSYIKSFGVCYNITEPHQKGQKFTGSCSKDKKLFRSLKILNLSFCEQLQRVGSFDELPSLEKLIVTNCNDLLEVCDTIKECEQLLFINLRNCRKLKKLPKTISMLKKLQTLLLDSCHLGELQIQSEDMIPETMKAIPIGLKFSEITLLSSLVELSLAYNSLSTESFPVDFSYLFTLKRLHLDGNPIVSLPICVRTLPRLEYLRLIGCTMLPPVVHPPYKLGWIVSLTDTANILLEHVNEVSPQVLSVYSNFIEIASFEIEGMVEIQPMGFVEEKVLNSLGWTNILLRGPEESEIQMYYEFGIFSTFYVGGEMPKWITYRSKGPSISFTIPSSPNHLRGLNFCYVLTFLYINVRTFTLPEIIISNTTKNCSWIHKHFINKVGVLGDRLILLSHWMFGLNEMEGGDSITITVTELLDSQVANQFTGECGVSFVYDDGKTDGEDVLGYYKLWPYIIGKDLSPFQTTIGEYYLDTRGFMEDASEEQKEDHGFMKEGKKVDAEPSFEATRNMMAIGGETKYDDWGQPLNLHWPNPKSGSGCQELVTLLEGLETTYLDEVLVDVPCLPINGWASTQHVDRGFGQSPSTYILYPACDSSYGPLDGFGILTFNRKKRLRNTNEDVIQELEQPLSEEDNENLSSRRFPRRRLMDITEETPESYEQRFWGGTAAKDISVPLWSINNDAILLDLETAVDFMSYDIPPWTEVKLPDHSYADVYRPLQIIGVEQVPLMGETANQGVCLVEQAQKIASVACNHDVVQKQTRYEESQKKIKAMEAEASIFHHYAKKDASVEFKYKYYPLQTFGMDFWAITLTGGWKERPAEACWAVMPPTFLFEATMQRSLPFADGSEHPYAAWWDVDRVFIPINIPGKHWMLGNLDLQSWTITIYDSMKRLNYIDDAMKILVKFEHILPKYLESINYWGRRSEDPISDLKLTIFPANSVPQQDSLLGDCGVFLCMFIEYLSRGQALRLKNNPRDAAMEYRRHMAEIIYASRVV